ncbi:hypothetical protein HX891_01390 [Pseudomonas reactans]|uniref:hypothetical protein n=1 Tax=Pseudomonas reactans TaxID=117680 RepID=UPI0015BADB91|nr:hypothetical protein [Pseudomonas reactans]NWD79015.1 hypothetical protein [Pseudomonas reactans]
MGIINVNISASKSSWNCNSSGPSKPEPAKPDPCKDACKDVCKPNKSMTIGFGVMPLGMIAFGGFGLGKFF